MSEEKALAPLMVDRAEPIGNSVGPDGRRAAHVRAFVSSPTQPVDYDSGEVDYPSDTVEIYTYKKAGSTIKTITITYTDNTKTAIAAWSIA